VAYSYTQAKNNLKSTEIASVLWQSQPVQGDPNRPELGFSESASGTASSAALRTSSCGRSGSDLHRLFVEVAEGTASRAGGNRYSFIYPATSMAMVRAATTRSTFPRPGRYHPRLPPVGVCSNVTAQQQWTRSTLIEQDPYLSQHRGEIAERHGVVNPCTTTWTCGSWWTSFGEAVRHNFQVSRHPNVGNLISSDWGW
jgi:hypothetical protein